MRFPIFTIFAMVLAIMNLMGTIYVSWWIILALPFTPLIIVGMLAVGGMLLAGLGFLGALIIFGLAAAWEKISKR